MSTPSVKESPRRHLAAAVEELVATASESSFDAVRFFEKFELLSNTPNAIESLRGLIRNLAIDGKFEPPSTDAAAVKLEDLAIKINSGATPNGGRKAYVESGVPLIRSMNVHFHGFVKEGLVFLTDRQADSLSNAVVEKDDVLLNITGASIGRVAVAPAEMHGARVNQHVTIIRPKEILFPAYLALYLASPKTQQFIDSIQVGATRQALTKGMIQNFKIPVPPVAEQKRIVAKVDELMGLCDRLEALEAERSQRHASLSRAALARFADSPTPTNLQFLFHNSFDVEPNELRESILTLAVRGKLVDRKIAADVKPIEESLAEPTFNGVSKGPTKDASKSEVLRISAGTSRRDFRVNENDFKHVDLTKDEIEKCQLKPGDLLACRFNGNLHYVGRFSIYEGTSGRVQVNPDKLIRFRIDTSRHLATYVCYAMNAPPTRRLIESLCATTAGNIGLSASKLRTIEIPLPPLSEQKRIVAKVDELMALVDQLEKQLAHSRTLGQQLLDAVVANLTATSV